MQPRMYKRFLFDFVVNHLNEREYSLISGARQTGKTVLLEQIQHHLERQNQAVYKFSLDDLTILEELNKHPENLFQWMPEPTSDVRLYVLLDEIQNLSNPSEFIKHLYNRFGNKLKIIATTGSGFFMDSEFKDALVGRVKIFSLYTLDFEEFLEFKADPVLIDEWQQIQKDESYTSYRRKSLENLFNEYLTFGGYPSVVLEKRKEQKIALLKELSSTYLKREIYESNIQNQDKLQRMFTILAYRTGSLVNMSELSNNLQLSITAIENYLFILRKSFHIQMVRPFYKNLKKELTKMPKIYFNDLGMRNVLINQFPLVSERIDRKELIENYVYIRLRKKFGNDQITYWRTADGNEVDFVIFEEKEKGFAIETKFNSVEYRTSKYKKFMKAYPDFPIQCRAYASETNDENVLGI